MLPVFSPTSSPANWSSIPSFPLDLLGASAFLRIEDLDRRTNVTLKAAIDFGGRTRDLPSSTLRLFKRPSLQFDPVQPLAPTSSR